jgi:hypothetical protein
LNTLKNKVKENFTIVPNELLRDNSISDRARFVYCVMAGKPENWKFYNKALAKELNYSVDTLRKYINELSENGWLYKIVKPFDANDYELNHTKFAVSEKTRHGENTTLENPDTYKDIPKVINTISKKEESIPAPDISKNPEHLWRKIYLKNAGVVEVKFVQDLINAFNGRAERILWNLRECNFQNIRNMRESLDWATGEIIPREEKQSEGKTVKLRN